jgi:hypothetical protein
MRSQPKLLPLTVDSLTSFKQWHTTLDMILVQMLLRSPQWD